VITLIGAANHDPAQFPDPDRLDITRKDVAPLSFGGGIHLCLGAQLARIEATEAFPVLLERLPNLRLANLEAPDWRATITLRGLKTLPATW
jgi:cytochrome P450